MSVYTDVPGLQGALDERLYISYAATGATVTRSAPARAGDRLSVYDFGVKADGRYVSDFLTITSADPRKLVIYTDTFVAGDVGKYLEVPGAGPSGGVLRTTISAVNGPQSVQMAAAASTMLPGNARAKLLFGSDDTAALQFAADFCAVTGKRLDFASQTICLVRNLVIKDTERTSYTDSTLILTIAGRGSTLRKIPGGDDTYLVAPERWVTNVAFHQQPCGSSISSWTAAGSRATCAWSPATSATIAGARPTTAPVTVSASRPSRGTGRRR